MGYRIDTSIRYIQLCQAFSAQFGSQPITLYQSNLETQLCDAQFDKPLSTIYRALLSSVHFGLEALYAKWQLDYPELDKED